ncbi:MAG: type I restriction enzyme HsdR N-terminal domain-containing protein [Desulfobacterales bacterium]|jgi:hypothetical protein
MKGHHLILGELEDFITGETIQDTLDERYRQKIAHFLVNQKGYFKKDIEPRQKLVVKADDHKAIVTLDFAVRVLDRIVMIIKFGPGSIVTRRRPVLAASRLLTSYQIPIAVATNGEDAEIIDGFSGNILSQGLETVPSRSELVKTAKQYDFKTISNQQLEIESRIVYCYEIDGSCPCDEDICRL